MGSFNNEQVCAALRALVDGNDRFASGLRSIETFLSATRMKDLAEKGQTPFAIIVTCSDSRLPAEILFDRGVGDLFVIRMAGNVVTPEVVASVEFAALKFKTPLCLVMGHTRCGAMDAATQIIGDGQSAPTPYLAQLIEHIRPPFEATRKRGCDHRKGNGEFLTALTTQNIDHGVSQILGQSKALSELAGRGEFAVMGALADLHDGRVKFHGSAKDFGLESDSFRTFDLAPIRPI